MRSLAPPNWRRPDGYEIDAAPGRIDRAVVVRFLTEDAYWTKGREPSAETIARALDNSLAFGVYAPGGEMVGFARLVTDYAIFAYLRDVFVLGPHRGRGLASWLARAVREHPEVAGVGSWLLATRDARDVYARAGWTPAPEPGNYMTIAKPPVPR